MLNGLLSHYYIIISLVVIVIVHSACERKQATEPSGGFEIIREGESVSIVDHTRKVWDITHAVNVYGFDPGKFDFGLGPAAIQPINNPLFLSPGQLGYPSVGNDIIVIGYKDEEEIRAYSLNILVHHEMVNDFYAKQPVAIAYCPLVNLTAVYSRQVYGTIVTLSASGWTYNETFVLYDIETESLWYPLPDKSGLTCISGTHADKSLAELPSSQVRWVDWFTENPGTKYLKSP
jgi:hypothetical protein